MTLFRSRLQPHDEPLPMAVTNNVVETETNSGNLKSSSGWLNQWWAILEFQNIPPFFINFLPGCRGMNFGGTHSLFVIVYFFFSHFSPYPNKED